MPDSLPWIVAAVEAWIESALPENTWILVPLILLGSYALAKLVNWLSRRYLTDSEELTTTSFGRAVLEEIHTPLAISIAVLGIALSLLALGIVDQSHRAVTVLVTVLVILWARTAIKIGSRWIEVVNGSETDYEFTPMFKNVWTIGVVLAAVLLVLSIWELRITPFLASAGVLGVIIGFAAQDAIGNLIGGVALYFDNTYKIGDVILVEDDMRGTVTDIGIRSTTVLTTDNVLVTVPNAVLNSAQVVNETSPQRHIRIRVPLSAAYDTDYREVERIVLEVCEDAPLVRESPAPRVLFDRFGDSALIFELQAYISHPLTQKRAVDQINRRVYDRFDEAGITIPFPQRELSFLEGGSEHRFEERFESRAVDPGDLDLPGGRPPGSDGAE
ncbi:mechanosensitive ion channel family protein [Natrononativus amylolyticus]|uniref:mechanosensitive ion channel family protein n=1 Tax=Natrononativus amylolyticus TaxID=2963434 RepID=UPI0020CF3C65|nr:mechanosensitive ion channel domain-containing protein [Natrononativus amylolyticus]